MCMRAVDGRYVCRYVGTPTINHMRYRNSIQLAGGMDRFAMVVDYANTKGYAGGKHGVRGLSSSLFGACRRCLRVVTADPPSIVIAGNSITSGGGLIAR